MAIDIGSDVGVQPGNEFLVYHPKFSGTQPFTYSDGRTVKKLGNYPRIPSGKITVHQAQRDISFCEIVENALTSTFPPGSQIEYIPLGSITHKVTRKGEFSELPILSEEELRTALEKRIHEESPFTAIALGIPNLHEITAQSGIAHANRLLSSIHQSLQRHSTRQTLITTLDTGSAIDFILLTPDSDVDSAMSLMDRVVDEHNKVVSCQAAACLSNTLTEMGIDLHNCFDLARLSKQIAEPTSVFDAETAHNVVQEWRTRSRYDEAIADYKKFIGFGIRDAHLENYAGLCYLVISPVDYASAIECFATAHSLDPEYRTFELNLAYTYSHDNKDEKSLDIFWKYHTDFIDGTEQHTGYMNAYVRSAVRHYMAQPSITEPAKLKELLNIAITRQDVCSFFGSTQTAFLKELAEKL